MAASLGFEPRKRLRTRGLTVSGIATWERQLFYVAATLGFEPRQRDSESLVLPLHYEATSEQNKDRCASLQVAQLPSRMNLRGGDLLCFEQDFGALLSTCDFQMASALCHQRARVFYHFINHCVIMIWIVMKKHELAHV